MILFAASILFTAFQAPPTGAPGHPGDFGYLVVRGTQLRQDPSQSSDLAGTVTEPTCVMRLVDSREGWIRLEPVKNDLAESLPNDPPIKREPGHRLSVAGWTKFDSDMVLPDRADLSLFIHIAVWMHKWPDTVAKDVLQHVVRIGFDEDQMRAAMDGYGDPRVQTTETAAGVTSVYLYLKAGKVIGLRNGHVVSITDTR